MNLSYYLLIVVFLISNEILTNQDFNNESHLRIFKRLIVRQRPSENYFL
jgi:hypothetical protein